MVEESFGPSVVEHRAQSVPHVEKISAGIGQQVQSGLLDPVVSLGPPTLFGGRGRQGRVHQPLIPQTPESYVHCRPRNRAARPQFDLLHDGYAIRLVPQPQDGQQYQLLEENGKSVFGVGELEVAAWEAFNGDV